MSARATIFSTALAIACVYGGSKFIAYLAQDAFPKHSMPILLAGLVVVTLPLALIGWRWTCRVSKEERAAILARVEPYLWVVVFGGFLDGYCSEPFKSIVKAAMWCGVLRSLWFLLRSVPGKGQASSQV